MSFLFGCSHKRTTFPISVRSNIKQPIGPRQTYIVCLECGQEFSYSWEEMKVVRRRPNQRIAVEEALAVTQ